MSVHIIELNDRNVRLRRRDDILVQSPGFANVVDKQPIFGDDARRVARLHPRQTYTQFWSQLSLDPLINSNTHFRHQADLAFSHLNAISAQHALKEEVIFAVPSNYNRNQLSILLGLVKSCPFDAVGLVDMPVLIAGNAGTNELTVYLDIQLHQSVLTTFSNRDGKVMRDKVVQIPGTGLLALYDAWANMVTDEFIKQSRFDPQHNAETEQFVHNQLDEWIGKVLRDNEILMEINNKGSVYQARVNSGHFEQRTRQIFGRIKTELDTLMGSDYALHVPRAQSQLPGLGLYLGNIQGIDDDLLLDNCLQHLEHIKGDPDALSFITSLPTVGAVKKTVSAAPQAAHAASHVLVGHKAYAIPATFRVDNGSIEADSQGSLRVSHNGSGVALDYPDTGAISINGAPISADSALKSGDLISLTGANPSLQLIQVE